MTPASIGTRRRKRTAAAAVVAAFLLPLGAGAATGQVGTDSPLEESSPPTSVAGPSPSPSANTLPDDPARTADQSHRLRARVRPSPNSDFGGPKTFPEAMGKVKDGACAQTHNLLWDGDPVVSRVKLRMIREEGDG